jgi:microcystin-dependent protein
LSNQYLGEIRMFAGNFAPVGWALCNGQLMPISQFTALFSLLGTSYGGNGTADFALPNLQGRVPIHAGNGAGLTPYVLGESGGVETATLTIAQLPAHNHIVNASSSIGTQPGPGNNIPASVSGAAPEKIYTASAPNAVMSSSTIGIAGGGQPVGVIQPFLCINFIIALVGIFPTRN